MRRVIFLLICFSAFAASLHAAEFTPSRAERMIGKHERESLAGNRFITVRTRSPSNREVRFFYHVPENYSPYLDRQYRVLVYFGGRNCTGENQVSGSLDFDKWADEHDIFIVSPGFKNDDYWHPEQWSGKALVDALKLLSRMYRIKPSRLLFYGYSGGSQCANLFPAMFPDYTVAWVSHGCGVFHDPDKSMREVPGLVTCGDADVGRYVLSRRFVSNSRRLGVNVLFKSFPNRPHDVPEESIRLAKEFLLYHHLRTLDDLGLEPPDMKDGQAFVGDDVDGVYYKPDAFEVSLIEPEDKVYLPSETIAKAWGAFRESGELITSKHAD